MSVADLRDIFVGLFPSIFLFMRILHTSDWHLGQFFHNSKQRYAEHQKFIDWLLEQIKSHRIDLVIIAGDVFDTGTPPSYARELYFQFVSHMNTLNCQLIVLGGNHDSVAVLNESKALLSCLKSHVIADANPEDLASQVITIKNSQDQAQAIVCAIPFLRPQRMMMSQSGQSAEEKSQQLSLSISQYYQQLFQIAQERKNQLGLDIPIIMTGHLTAVGASKSDSVREIYIGTLDAFSADLFPKADYIALGHIHRSQKVSSCEHIRYCGSPIPLSFDESTKEKSVLIVEFSKGKLEQVLEHPIPTFQSMKKIKGDLQYIEQALQTYATHEGEPVWISIEVENQTYLNDLHHRIQTMVEDLPVEILHIGRAKTSHQALVSQYVQEHLSELTPTEVFERRLACETFETDVETQQQERIKAMFQEILESIESVEPA